MRVISVVDYKKALKKTLRARATPLYVDGILNLDHPSVQSKIRAADKRVDFKGFRETCHYVVSSSQEK